jgi:hypothetical protein
MVPFPQPHHVPCGDCGASVARGEVTSHVCEEQRRLDFTVLQLGGSGRLDEQFASYLETPRGRFEAWYAARRR